jgi:hypothetical protein
MSTPMPKWVRRILRRGPKRRTQRAPAPPPPAGAAVASVSTAGKLHPVVRQADLVRVLKELADEYDQAELDRGGAMPVLHASLLRRLAEKLEARRG